MGSQQAELGKRLAGKMGWPTQKTAAGTSLAGHDFRQRKSGKTGRTGCPDARSFPISIRRGQKSSICEELYEGNLMSIFLTWGNARGKFPHPFFRLWTAHISAIFVHEAPIFEKKGSADGHGPGWRRRTRTRPVLAGRELGRNRLGDAQAVDGGAHDTARVTCAFAARVDASGRLLVRIGQIACQSRLKVLPTNHADGA